MSDRIRITSAKTLHDGWSRFTQHEFDYLREDGSWQTLSREVLDHGHVAAVLPFDSARQTVVLSRQFRFPAYQNGEGGWLIEAPAGLLDGETPEISARREVLEETGYELGELRPAGRIMVSPGALTEIVYCFVGEYHAGARKADGGGVEDEGEEIEVLEMPLDAALRLIGTGEIIDAKTIVLLQHLALSQMAEKP